ncbi:MAG: class I SAM-dependent methyltransferase [Candidatus Goldbacteria bacterium]|nr:class I SAM-dependent methyltransferase [Candidatus Goldiibacteriota bacterium]
MNYFNKLFIKIKKAFLIIKNFGIYEFIVFSFYRFFNKEIRDFLYKFLSIFYNKKIKNFQFNDINELVDFGFKVGIGIIRPTQKRYEILELLNLLSKRQISNVLEIGTENGGTLFFWGKILKENGILISLDLPLEKNGYGYKEWRSNLFKNFVKDNQKLFLLRDDSHSFEALENIKKILNSEKLDFLFIDGDHSYEGVKKDFEMYSGLVKEGGLIAFHDIVFHSRGGSEVDRFWKEIKNKFNYEEFVDDWNQDGCGIGVIYYKR